jgi:cytochrome c oxidase subunit IV
MASTPGEREHALVPQSLYVKIWATLLVLTVTTVAVSYLDMQNVRVLTAMMIATAKASLVVLYFMHIRFEKPLFGVLILVVLATYGILIGLTFSDYWYR